MKKTSSQSGFFNPRILIAVVLGLTSAGLGWLGLASTPSSGVLSDSNPVLTYDAGPFNLANQSPLGLGQLDTGPRCDAADPCDSYTLTVNLPAGYAAAHPLSGIKITMFWTDTGSGQSNYDLYIYNGINPTVDGSHPADHQSASNANPEVAVINPVIDGTTQYTLEIVPNTPTQETVHVRIELLPGTGGLNPNFGGPDPTTPGVPRYQIFFPPAGSTAEPSHGEFNIGFNPNTKRIMTMNSGPIWRLTPGEIQTPAKPECCEALWEDRSAITTNTPADLDPILWTDQKTGRTFASNSTAGANVSYAYSDSDGVPSMTQPTGWTEAGFSPPDNGADHETIGSGPYPLVAGLPNPLATVANQGEAVYYCSQDVVGPASCQRSDTLGVSYGPGVFAYAGNGTGCGGLHGHIHVAPDGTAWLPVNQCGGVQGGALTTDAGMTWQQFFVTGSHSQQQGADPSIGIDANSTVYYAYVNNEPVAAGNPPEGHAHVKVSHDHGATWINDFDLGASHGIKNAAEIEAVGGSAGRAAVAFLGTDVNGDYQANSFPGKWYPFIATTYDGGATWTTINSMPNDPVQSRTGIWQQGGGALDRNLLDFTEITIDDKGRVLYGFSDGCVTPDCIGGAAPNDFVAHMRVARQSGGKSLFESNDANTDTTVARLPKPACLSGTRDPLASHLTWKVPDNGGADIARYEIWRGTAPGNESKLFTTLNPDPHYSDTNPPSSTHLYYYVKAINSVGTGTQSNEIDLVTVLPAAPESACAIPGLTKLTDPAGDTSLVLGVVSTPAPPGSDLLSFQLAQPYQSDGISRLIFTINTDPGESPQPPGSAWYVAMRIAGPDPTVPGDTSTVHYRGVHMIWNSTTPTFESYIPGANGSGGVDGRFIGSVIGPAEAGSSYAAPFNKVVIIVKASDLGLNPGDAITGFLAGVSQSDPTQSTVTALNDSMPDSLSFANSYVTGHNNVCAALPTGIVSRLNHGAAGPFDIALPGSSPAGIECRSGGANKAYTLIYTLGTNLRSPGAATVSQGSATAASPTIGPNLNQVSVNLTNVTNAQHLVVDLSGLLDSLGNPIAPLSAHVDVLLGDTTANGAVNSSDIAQTQSESGHALSTSNFRTDVTANGAINSSDIATVQSQSGTGLPATPAQTTAPASTAPTKKHSKKTDPRSNSSF
jgi:hypothetical protein